MAAFFTQLLFGPPSWMPTSQKDVWHLLEDVRTVIRDVERETWGEAVFDPWAALDAQMGCLLEQRSRLHSWQDCGWASVEKVDWRSAEICDRAINQWLINET